MVGAHFYEAGQVSDIKNANDLNVLMFKISIDILVVCMLELDYWVIKSKLAGHWVTKEL